jgi:hypothetical protein
LSKLGIIEYFDLTGIEKRCHPLIIAPARKCALQDHTVIAGKNTGDLIWVAFGYHHGILHDYKKVAPIVAWFS